MTFILPVDPAAVNSTEGNTDLLSESQFQRLSGTLCPQDFNGSGSTLAI